MIGTEPLATLKPFVVRLKIAKAACAGSEVSMFYHSSKLEQDDLR